MMNPPMQIGGFYHMLGAKVSMEPNLAISQHSIKVRSSISLLTNMTQAALKNGRKKNGAPFFNRAPSFV